MNGGLICLNFARLGEKNLTACELFMKMVAFVLVLSQIPAWPAVKNALDGRGMQIKILWH